MIFKKIIKKIFKFFGVNISRSSKDNYDVWPQSNFNSTTVYEDDVGFHKKYNSLLVKLNMKDTDNPLRRNRHYLLSNLIKIAPIQEGDIAECGCWKGLSSSIIASELKNKNFKNNFYIFDSFEGLSEFNNFDFRENNKNIDAEKIRKHFASSLEMVKANLSEFSKFINFKKGWVPKRFKEVKDNKFSFVHIDLDLYEPTKESLNFFGEKIIKGGIILLDDYGSLDFPGAKLATDNFLKNNNGFSFLPLSYGSAFLIKK
tara:strand:- start:16677 stop:17450 length:774 start_codon:yes stop_codon:yes gene_type:complete